MNFWMIWGTYRLLNTSPSWCFVNPVVGFQNRIRLRTLNNSFRWIILWLHETSSCFAKFKSREGCLGGFPYFTTPRLVSMYKLRNAWGMDGLSKMRYIDGWMVKNPGKKHYVICACSLMVKIPKLAWLNMQNLMGPQQPSRPPNFSRRRRRLVKWKIVPCEDFIGKN